MFSRSIRICFALGWAALLTAAAPVGAWAEKKPAGSQPHPPTYYLPKLLPSIADADSLDYFQQYLSRESVRFNEANSPAN